jgi:hypothetical protein
MNFKKKLKEIIITLSILISCFSCKDKIEKEIIQNHKTEKWEKINFDINISKNEVFKRLNNEDEINSPFDKDISKKKTSDVEYLNDRNPNSNNLKYSKLNNCRAYLYKRDTIKINIGIGNGFSGSGFNIYLNKGKFYTEPYYWTDVVIDGEKESKYKIKYQKLILNKSDYEFGDSIYGKIEFESIEINNRNEKINHSGKGLFRTRLKI